MEIFVGTYMRLRKSTYRVEKPELENVEMDSFSLSRLFLGVLVLDSAEKILRFFGSPCIRWKTVCLRVFYTQTASYCGVFVGIGLNEKRSDSRGLEDLFSRFLSIPYRK
jgi:hypothetical protein